MKLFDSKNLWCISTGEEDYSSPDYPYYPEGPLMIDDIERKPCEKSVSLFLADFNAVPSDGIAGSYSYSNSCKIQREMESTAPQT